MKRSKANKEKKAKKSVEAEIAVNAFKRFRDLEVADSDKEDRKPPAVKSEPEGSDSDKNSDIESEVESTT